MTHNHIYKVLYRYTDPAGRVYERVQYMVTAELGKTLKEFGIDPLKIVSVENIKEI